VVPDVVVTDATLVIASVRRLVIPFWIVPPKANIASKTANPIATRPNIFLTPYCFLKQKKGEQGFYSLSPSSALIG
jgi:hypothetical protein